MITDSNMDAIFHALGHTSRRKILDILKSDPGCTVGKLAQQFDVSRIAVMNHLAVLERAGLITSQKVNRSRQLFLNAAPIQMIHERWLDQYSGFWANQLLRLKAGAEHVEMGELKTNGEKENE